jgi:hypothetical protein
MNQRIFRSVIVVLAWAVGVAGTASAGTGAETWNFAQLAAWQANTQITPDWSTSVDSQTFTQGSDTLTATAVGWSSSTSWADSSGTGTGTGPCTVQSRPCLYDKSGNTSDEVGLGLTPDLVGSNDYEIYNYKGTPYGIGIQASAGSEFLTSVTFGSVNTSSNGKSESWALDGCTGAFASCTTLDSGVGGGTNGILTLNLNPAQAYASYVFFVPCANQSSCATLTGAGQTNAPNNFLLNSVTLSNTAPVPEPPNWLLFIVGTGLVGLMSRRRRGRTAV